MRSYSYTPPAAPPGYGYYGYSPNPTSFGDMVHRMSMLGLVMFYFIMIFNVIALVYAVFVVPENIVNEDIEPFFFVVPYPPFLVGLDLTITGPGAVAYFLLLAASIFVSIETLVIRDGKTFWRLGKRLLSANDLTEAEELAYDRNGFVLLGELFMAVLFFNVCYIILLYMIGIETSSPDIGEWRAWEQMFAFARASVWEEVISRIMLIGIPLFMIRAYTTRDLGFESENGKPPTRRPWYNYFLGGNFSITPTTAVLIFISSLLFGLAHMGSWDAFKVVPTLVAGLALGYLFVKKGVHMSILLHFAIDYLTVLPEALGGDIATILEVMIGFVFLALLLLGTYMFYKYARRFVEYVALDIPGLSFMNGERAPMAAGSQWTGPVGSVERTPRAWQGQGEGAPSFTGDRPVGWGGRPDEEEMMGERPENFARERAREAGDPVPPVVDDAWGREDANPMTGREQVSGGGGEMNADLMSTGGKGPGGGGMVSGEQIPSPVDEGERMDDEQTRSSVQGEGKNETEHEDPTTAEKGGPDEDDVSGENGKVPPGDGSEGGE
jgi:hypothetical protein